MIDILNDVEKKDSARRQMALANAAAALLVGGKVDDLSSGVELGNEVIESGKAYEKVRQLIRYTNGDESKLDRIEASHDRLS
jgi:anthranilate phosphoribosyltransferase